MFDGKPRRFWYPEEGVLATQRVRHRTSTFVVRPSARGKPSPRLVWPSTSAEVALGPREPRGDRDREFSPVEGTGGHDETKPLDGSVAFEFSRKGEGRPSADRRVVPRHLFPTASTNRCRRLRATVSSSRSFPRRRPGGRQRVALRSGGALPVQARRCDASPRGLFKEANRVLFHTYVPCNSNPIVQTRARKTGRIRSARSTRPERPDDTSSTSAIRTLDCYRKPCLTAQIRCW